MPTTITVLLADDHPLVRKGVQATLQQTSDIVIVAETGTTENLSALCLGHQPEVLILDIHMPGPPLASTLAALRTDCPDVAILILSADAYPTALRAVQQDEVTGYILKADVAELLAVAIRSVARGATWYSQRVLQALLVLLPEGTDPLISYGLTVREVEILTGIAEGLANVAISRKLHIGEQTVRNYTSRIYTKLGVPSRAAAVLWALDHGIGNDN